MFLIFCIVLAIYTAYNVYIKLNYWKWKGVKYITPVPFFGNMTPFFTRQKCLTDFINDLYKKFPNDRYFGMYQFHTPILFIRDPELVKMINVKNFDNFMDHQGFITPEADRLWGSNLFSSKGKRWQEIRAFLSPLFTSSKMKTMFTLMDNCGKNFINNLKEKNGASIELEMKYIFERLTNDIILSASFGIQCDSLKDENNEFLKKGKELTDLSGIKMLKFGAYINFPFFVKLFGLKIVDTKIGEFFENIVKETIQMREKNGIVKPDLINLLMNMEKTQPVDNNKNSSIEDENHQDNSKTNQKNALKEPLNKHEWLANALGFYFGGLSTTTSFLVFTTYELAVNPEIQEKLRDEFKKCTGPVTYEFLAELKFLDMFISEALRMWPQGNFTDRKCTKPFTIEPERPGEVRIDLKVGDIIWTPFAGLHFDPNYFPEPTKFDPGRFSDENKHEIKQGTYGPFGIGPRSCIGARFAILEAKIAFYYILTNFEIVPINRTQIPLRISKNCFSLETERGLWLGFKKITA